MALSQIVTFYLFSKFYLCRWNLPTKDHSKQYSDHLCEILGTTSNHAKRYWQKSDFADFSSVTPSA